jgi:uncharacterized RDD family membrane protein YckC
MRYSLPGSIQGQYAGGVTRGIAWSLDQIILIVTIALVTWLVSSTFQLFGITISNCSEGLGPISFLACQGTRYALILLTLLASPVYFVFFWTINGQTLGDALLGIRVVRTDGKPMTVLRSIRRFIGYLVCYVTLGIGFLLIFVDNERQGLHDHLAGTCVIYAWRGEQNMDTIARVQAWFARRKTPDKTGTTPATQ